VSHMKPSSTPPQPYDPSSRSSSYFHRDFPDPLFGSSLNAAIPPLRPRTTSHEDRLTPGHHYESDRRAPMMRQQFSFATAPESTVEPLVPFADQIESSHSFHRSLPNIHYQQQDDQIDPFDDDESLHQSMPNIIHSQQETIASARSDKMMPTVKSMEPIPFHRINLTGKPKETYPPPSPKKHSLDESIPAASTGSMLLSRDLIECLDKMTCHSIHDSNPFEPIPLTPRQEREIAARRQQQQLRQIKPMEEQLSSDSAPSIDPMDESERIDEFAEG
jgi:hypothetical protein